MEQQLQELEQQLQEIEQQSLRGISQAESSGDLEQIRIKYLGKKGEVTLLLKEVGKTAPSERPRLGKLANEVKEKISASLEEKTKEVRRKERSRELLQEAVDITLPGLSLPMGRTHPLALLDREIKQIFVGLGFEVAVGPEVESDYYNFEALNIPSDHPAREMWDSFYLGNHLLLRTHTSPVQIRVMEKRTPPLRVISSGKCYRRDAVDATHHIQFHQVEGFMVDQGVSFSDLKGVLSAFAREMFGEERKVKFVPSYFPFTEPSAEVSIDCFACADGKGREAPDKDNRSGAGGATGRHAWEQPPPCRVCGGGKWLEILGCGMIHPFVLRVVNYDPEKWSGFAFGMGLERIAMLKHGIDDIRLFLENDIRFLRQFS